jgi:hypothetical protein
MENFDLKKYLAEGKLLKEETDLGHFGMFEGKKVPLDFPMEDETRNKPKYLIHLTYKVDENWFTNPIEISNTTLHFLSGVVSYELKDSYNNGGKFIAHYKLITNINKQELYKNLLGSSTNSEEWTIGINEAEFKGKDVSLNKPKRGGSKAYYVYVKDGDKVKKVSFGSGGLKAKINNLKKK